MEAHTRTENAGRYLAEEVERFIVLERDCGGKPPRSLEQAVAHFRIEEEAEEVALRVGMVRIIEAGLAGDAEGVRRHAEAWRKELLRQGRSTSARRVRRTLDGSRPTRTATLDTNQPPAHGHPD